MSYWQIAAMMLVGGSLVGGLLGELARRARIASSRRDRA